ncbi:hypothetical protein CLOM_g18020 [Closterium sp. NIES-68]|nr:hypothetical protein CLOM_g18020 [Closterium sp. NIES-68]GJP75390.1 hypothetical protein CLOP_g5843 [Closterium sp. NIES-67]
MSATPCCTAPSRFSAPLAGVAASRCSSGRNVRPGDAAAPVRSAAIATRACCSRIEANSSPLSQRGAGLRSSVWGDEQTRTEIFRPPPLSNSRRRTAAVRATAEPSTTAAAPTAAEGGADPAPIPLLAPYQMGAFALAHRVVLAPLTRCRALNNVAQPAAATYYAQRATAGQLLIAEATAVGATAHGYPNMPGLYTCEQVEAWKPVVQAVKAKGGIFFCQLWHAGRASHPDYQPGGALPLAPSAVPITDQQVYTGSGMQDYPTPRPMTEADIKTVIAEFRVAARGAMEAGFDGVEIHGGNGYLVEQFLKDGINRRSDQYGGTIANRVRFLEELVAAVGEEVGPERLGVRLSPYSAFLSASDSDPRALYVHAVQRLDAMGVLYVHLIEPRMCNFDELPGVTETLEPFRGAFSRTVIAAGGYTRERGSEAIATCAADLVAFGRLFIANPDLPRRFLLNAPLNAYDRNTFYVSDQVHGYTDYPFLDS